MHPQPTDIVANSIFQRQHLPSSDKKPNITLKKSQV